MTAARESPSKGGRARPSLPPPRDAPSPLPGRRGATQAFAAHIHAGERVYAGARAREVEREVRETECEVQNERGERDGREEREREGERGREGERERRCRARGRFAAAAPPARPRGAGLLSEACSRAAGRDESHRDGRRQSRDRSRKSSREGHRNRLPATHRGPIICAGPPALAPGDRTSRPGRSPRASGSAPSPGSAPHTFPPSPRSLFVAPAGRRRGPTNLDRRPTVLLGLASLTDRDGLSKSRRWARRLSAPRSACSESEASI